MNYLELVKTPDPKTINGLAKRATVAELIEMFGSPHGSDDPPALDVHIVTLDVGPFRCTGVSYFLIWLKGAFETVLQKDPELYAICRSAGCRNVRKSRFSNTWSVHAFSLAIDIQLGNRLDTPGDGKTQKGLIRLYELFKEYGQQTGKHVYWLAENGKEDSMHFEADLEFCKQISKQITQNKARLKK
jgi:hypothetical protein